MNRGTYRCPLCERDCAGQGAAKLHLMVEHRKSDVADGLMRAADGRTR